MTNTKEMSEFEALIKTVANEEIAAKVINKIIAVYGGQQLYIPKRLSCINRDKQIFENFDGKNLRELCRKYDLSAQHVYKIIRQERIKKQIDLFD
jgi:Mor family transcriptional regulator